MGGDVVGSEGGGRGEADFLLVPVFELWVLGCGSPMRVDVFVLRFLQGVYVFV